jgi:MYXO-CTERM domain-containing protein
MDDICNKDIAMRLILPTALLTAASPATNLLVNGDFETGNNSGFQSDYFYLTSGTNQTAGEYMVVTQMSDAHPGISSQFGNLKGYGGTGYFMFANGATSTTQSPWKATLTNPVVTLTTDLDTPLYYRFEAMVANTDGPAFAPPGLSFEISIDGSQFRTFVATPDLTNRTQLWTLVYADTYFFTSAPGSINLRLRNTETNASGNDFALDNIYFGVTTQSFSYLRGVTTIQSAGDITNPTPVPEPSTYGIALGALALGLAAVRRRRKS